LASLSIGAPLRNLEGGFNYRRLCEKDEGGSRNWAFLCEEAQCGGPLRSAPLLGTMENILSKALNMVISLHRGPAGETRGDSLAGTF